MPKVNALLTIRGVGGEVAARRRVTSHCCQLGGRVGSMKLLQIREREGGFYRSSKYNVFCLAVNVLHESYQQYIPSRKQKLLF